MARTNRQSRLVGQAANSVSPPSDPVVDLVLAALARPDISVLASMLEVIALANDAYGCILWQVAPPTAAQKDVLFVLAHWFRDAAVFARHDLPLDDSVTGGAVRTGKTRHVRDVRPERVHWDRFMEENGIRVFCSVPVAFVDEAPGAINLYRRVHKPFSRREIERIERLACVVPPLYQTIRDRVSFDLLSRLTKRLHEADLQTVQDPGAVKELLQTLCIEIQSSFHCLEVSIFLDEGSEAAGTFSRMATVWPAGELFGQTSYRRDASDGATGWALAHGRPVKIFDLARYDADAVASEYRGLVLRESEGIAEAVRSLLATSVDENLRPLSLMVAPILWGDTVHGAVRCSVATRGPFYFAERELALLALVAAQLGRYWSNLLGQRRTDQQLESFKALVGSMIALNGFVHQELNHQAPDESRIFDEALSITSDVIRGSEISDIRLVDAERENLYFAAIHGKEWTPERARLRFSLTGNSAGAHVMRTGKAYVINDVAADPYYFGTFPTTRRLIVAPLSLDIDTSSGDSRDGVLDIRSTVDRDLPDHAVPMANLLASQLALYRFLTGVIRRLHDSVADQRRLQEQQIQVFQDMDHQFRGPINQAFARVKFLLKTVDERDARLFKQLSVIHGLCAKARRVSINSGLFADLARSRPIEVKKEEMEGSALVKLLIELGQDNHSMTDPERHIRWWVAHDGFDEARAVWLDRGLLEQAVSDVLDNAFKYCYERTVVTITVRYTKTGRLSISVEDEGIPILSGEPAKCVVRGWQSEWAMAVSDGGQGLGLWITYHIMRAHGGDLIIEPSRGRKTAVQLVFPVR